jgi:hypothetical protein
MRCRRSKALLLESSRSVLPNDALQQTKGLARASVDSNFSRARAIQRRVCHSLPFWSLMRAPVITTLALLCGPLAALVGALPLSEVARPTEAALAGRDLPRVP